MKKENSNKRVIKIILFKIDLQCESKEKYKVDQRRKLKGTKTEGEYAKQYSSKL